MYQIKFGTDGWREIIADEFTVANVRRVANATALWLNQSELPKSCVVGYDCRFGGEMFAKETARQLAAQGIKVVVSKGFVSTPMISLAAHQLQTGAGIILTASHNPPTYNGYKIKANYGGPAVPSEVSKVENLISPTLVDAGDSFESYFNNGMIEYGDFETMYYNHCLNSFDMDALSSISSGLVYDAMYGAGQLVIRDLFPHARLLHCSHNPGFDGQAPEPIARNLTELSERLANDPSLEIGLAVDGDADRIGLLNASGDFVDSHHILMLLVAYLAGVQGKKGDVVVSFSVSPRMERLCRHFGLNLVVTPIGFKYICEIMTQGGVLVGGEESGGIAIDGYIPERDGLWIGLTLMEYMAKSGKTLENLIEEVYAVSGPFFYDRWDLHIENDHKARVMEAWPPGPTLPLVRTRSSVPKPSMATNAG